MTEHNGVVLDFPMAVTLSAKDWAQISGELQAVQKHFGGDDEEQAARERWIRTIQEEFIAAAMERALAQAGLDSLEVVEVRGL